MPVKYVRTGHFLHQDRAPRQPGIEEYRRGLQPPGRVRGLFYLLLGMIAAGSMIVTWKPEERLNDGPVLRGAAVVEDATIVEPGGAEPQYLVHLRFDGPAGLRGMVRTDLESFEHVQPGIRLEIEYRLDGAGGQVEVLRMSLPGQSGSSEPGEGEGAVQ